MPSPPPTHVGLDGVGLTVQVATDMAGLQRHLSAWEQLASSAPHGEWFASPAWLLPWFEVYGSGRPLHVCFVYRGDTLVGVCPLLRLSANGARCAPSVGFPVNAQVRRVGALSDIPLAELLTTVLPVLAGDAAVRCLTFQRVPTGGDFAGALETAVDQLGLHAFSRSEPGSAVVELVDGWEAYVATRDGKLLRNLRSRRRRLDQEGDWCVRLVEQPSAFPEAWAAVLEIERASWKHAQGSSLDSEPTAGHFYRDVAVQVAARGGLRLHLLERAGEPVAYALGVADRGTYYLLKNSYHEAFRRWSPGLVLVWQAMADAAAAGCHTLDFLGDVTDWKRDFATVLPAYTTTMVYPSGSLHCHGCRVLEETLKPLGRSLGVGKLLNRVRGRG